MLPECIKYQSMCAPSQKGECIYVHIESLSFPSLLYIPLKIEMHKLSAVSASRACTAAHIRLLVKQTVNDCFQGGLAEIWDCASARGIKIVTSVFVKAHQHTCVLSRIYVRAVRDEQDTRALLAPLYSLYYSITNKKMSICGVKGIYIPLYCFRIKGYFYSVYI